MIRSAILLLVCFIYAGTKAQDSTRKLKRVLFLGNSITYAGGYVSDIETYILALFPDETAEFINLGVPSETVSGLSEQGHADGKFPRPDLHERLARVLAATKPDLVFACYGMNDGIYLPFDEKRFAAFKNGIGWLHTTVEASGAKIIHLTPPVYDESKNPGVKYAYTLKRYTEWLLAQRRLQHWDVTDLHNPMLKYLQIKRTADPGFALAKDGVHPAEAGHWLMAQQILAGTGHKEVLASKSIDEAFAGVKNGKQIVALIRKRQVLMRDAWLRQTKHLRPGLAEGLPMQEALDSCRVLSKELQGLLPPVVISVNSSGSSSVFQKSNKFSSLDGAVKKALTYADRDVIIKLAPGRYYPDTTIVIASAQYHLRSLIIEGDSNRRPVISGEKFIKPRWQPYKNGIVMARLELESAPDRLFAGNKSRPMARYPNLDSAARVFNGTAADAISAERISQWKKPAGGYVHALHEGEWGGFHYRVTGKSARNELQLEGGWQNNRAAPMHKKHRFVENIFEELDAPGEWFFDSGKKTLYYYPMAGEDPAKIVFSVSRLTELLVIKGDPENPVKNITISNLQFTNTNRSFMLTREPLLRSDWTIYRGGAILLDGAENINISHCTFSSLGGNAIFMSNYNRNNHITNNHIYNIGANAISFVGNASAVRSPAFNYNEAVNWQRMDTLRGPKTNEYPAACTAGGNLVHDAGTIEKQVAGVQIAMSADIHVIHNTIYNVPRSGINIGDGCWGGHLLEYNDVFNTVLETGDHGAFNSWGRDRFWSPDRGRIDSLVAARPGIELLDVIKPIIIRNNRFQCDHGWDIDLDDGSSNYRIYNNICLSGGLKLREGYHRTVENNIIINNTFHPHVWLKNSDDVFRHNIVTTAYAPIQISEWGRSVDRNIFPDSSTLAAVQKMGVDSHGIVGGVDFINAAGGDFRLQNSSAALRAGFVNFQMDVGVTDLGLKNKAGKPIINPIISTTIANDGKPLSWLGSSLKNISTLGEQSAAGLPDRNGVLVTGIKPGTPGATAGLQTGDVIIKLGDKIVTNTANFLRIYETVRWMGEVNSTIMRNQSARQLVIRFRQ